MPWAPSDLPSMAGKVALVTGATSGVGLYAAKSFARQGAKVVLACRNVHKMKTVADAMREEIPNADLILMQVDLSDLDSVRRFAHEFGEKAIEAIDVLMNNAGIAYGPYQTSPQGFEGQFATNHLGHWLLTGLLLKYVKNHPGARIVVVASLAHKGVSEVNYTVVKGEDPSQYGGFYMYSMTKLANLWFVRELNRRLVAAGSDAVVVGAHPGTCWSGILDRHKSLHMRLIRLNASLVCQSTEKGSWPLLMAATDPDVKRDAYYGPTRFFEMYGVPDANASVSDDVNDEEKAKELWTVSEELCNFSYEI